MKKILAFLLSALLIFSIKIVEAENIVSVKIQSVYDGDTYTIEVGGKKEKIRLIGVDTPEVRKSKKEQCLGKRVAKSVKKLLEGETVTLETDTSAEDADMFGRKLRYVIADNGDFGTFLLEEGYASVYKRYPFEKKKEYEKLEKKAKKEKKGIWGKVCHPKKKR